MCGIFGYIGQIETKRGIACTNTLSHRGPDGVGVHKSIKFKNRDTTDIACEHVFNKTNEAITLDDLLQKTGLCSLYSTFMFTKEAFTKAGGYPTTHGFDTQGFAWRFLAAGLHAETCPDTAYLHRVNFTESYYLREYNNGKANLNWLEIFKEHFHIFTDEAQRYIRTFPANDFTQDIYTGLIAKDNIFLLGGKKNQSWPTNEPFKKPVKINSWLGWFFRVRAKLRKFLNQHESIKSLLLDSLHTYQDLEVRLTTGKKLVLLYNYSLLRIKKMLGVGWQPGCVPNKILVDIVIPTIGKDFSIFDLYLKHLKQNICENIGTIYVVSSAQETQLISYCQEHNLKFINEESVLGYNKSHINYTYEGTNRAGWLFQQLLKLSGDRFVQNENYIIVDSDTILTQPHHFIEAGKTVFYENREWQASYFEAFKRLFGYSAPHHLSLTSHMMLFNTKKLKLMKNEIESKHSKSWDEAYIDCCLKDTPSGISDYDTYAQWFIKNFPAEAVCKPFYNKSLKRSIILTNPDKITSHKRVRSLSLHSYN